MKDKICRLRMAHGASTKSTLSFILDLSHEIFRAISVVFAKKPILGKTNYLPVKFSLSTVLYIFLTSVLYQISEQY